MASSSTQPTSAGNSVMSGPQADFRDMESEGEAGSSCRATGASASAGLEIVFYDVETTIPVRKGEKHEILEFGAVVLNARGFFETRCYCTLVRPSSLSRITKRSTEINGIGRENVQSSRTFAELADDIYELMHGKVWAGHNIKCFDNARIREAFQALGRQPPEPQGVVDTLELLRRRFGPRAGNMKMASLGSYCGLGVQSHRSLDDVRMNIEVFKQCASMLLLESEQPDIFGALSPSPSPFPRGTSPVSNRRNSKSPTRRLTFSAATALELSPSARALSSSAVLVEEEASVLGEVQSELEGAGPRPLWYRAVPSPLSDRAVSTALFDRAVPSPFSDRAVSSPLFDRAVPSPIFGSFSIPAAAIGFAIEPLLPESSLAGAVGRLSLEPGEERQVWTEDHTVQGAVQLEVCASTKEVCGGTREVGASAEEAYGSGGKPEAWDDEGDDEGDDAGECEEWWVGAAVALTESVEKDRAARLARSPGQDEAAAYGGYGGKANSISYSNNNNNNDNHDDNNDDDDVFEDCQGSEEGSQLSYASTVSSASSFVFPVSQREAPLPPPTAHSSLSLSSRAEEELILAGTPPGPSGRCHVRGEGVGGGTPQHHPRGHAAVAQGVCLRSALSALRDSFRSTSPGAAAVVDCEEFDASLLSATWRGVPGSKIPRAEVLYGGEGLRLQDTGAQVVFSVREDYAWDAYTGKPKFGIVVRVSPAMAAAVQACDETLASFLTRGEHQKHCQHQSLALAFGDQTPGQQGTVQVTVQQGQRQEQPEQWQVLPHREPVEEPEQPGGQQGGDGGHVATQGGVSELSRVPSWHLPRGTMPCGCGGGEEETPKLPPFTLRSSLLPVRSNAAQGSAFETAKAQAIRVRIWTEGAGSSARYRTNIFLCQNGKEGLSTTSLVESTSECSTLESISSTLAVDAKAFRDAVPDRAKITLSCIVSTYYLEGFRGLQFLADTIIRL